MVTSRTRPDIHQIATFLSVVEARSFAGAARILGRSQPAVSQEIARLEGIYGGDLFARRRGAPLTLTPIGEAILPSARIILNTIDRQMIDAVATAQSRAGNLTIGFYPGLLAGPLRAGITAFRATSPRVRLHLIEALPAELHRQLNDRTIDFAVVALMPKLDSKSLVQEHLWGERMMVALQANHVLSQQTSLSWHEVAELPLILKNSHFELVAYRTLLDRIDRNAHVEQHDVSCGTLLDMVGLGMGATIVFESGAMSHNSVVFRPISEDDATVGFDAVWPTDDRNPLRHRLLSLIRAHKDKVGAVSIEPISPSMGPTAGRG